MRHGHARRARGPASGVGAAAVEGTYGHRHDHGNLVHARGRPAHGLLLRVDGEDEGSMSGRHGCVSGSGCRVARGVGVWLCGWLEHLRLTEETAAEAIWGWNDDGAHRACHSWARRNRWSSHLLRSERRAMALRWCGAMGLPTLCTWREGRRHRRTARLRSRCLCARSLGQWRRARGREGGVRKLCWRRRRCWRWCRRLRQHRLPTPAAMMRCSSWLLHQSICNSFYSSRFHAWARLM
mmetsp:Transcript_52076/g.111396  ORF Transcript_52076/g.111396 Transcript_52076/m.111396 type:complete len:238 (+) Transcript_52076:583-1296(+)